MDPSNSGRNPSSNLTDYSTGNRYQSHYEYYDGPYNTHVPPQSMFQNYFAHDLLNDTHDIHFGHDESAQNRQRRYYRDQKPNYRGGFTAGKSSRFENGSGHTDDDRTLRGQCSVPYQEDEVDGKFIKELSENASEDKTLDISHDNNIQRKRRNKQMNKSFHNLSGPERSSAGNWRNKPGGYSQNFNEHDSRQNGFRQRDVWSRSYNGGSNELAIGHASSRYEHGYHGRGRNHGRRKPENFVESCDNEDWESMSENRDYRDLYVEAHKEADIRETDLLSLASARESLSNRQLEIPVDSCSNSASSRSSAGYQESGARPKSGSFRDRKSHSKQDFENSDKLVQNLSTGRSDRHYERKSQGNRNFGLCDDGNGISREEMNRDGFSIPDKNSFVCEKQTRCENDKENFSDRRKGGHSKLTANKHLDSSGRLVQKKSDSQDASSVSSSGYQTDQSKTNWNANRNQRHQRRNNEGGCKNRTAENKQNLQDRDMERVSYKYNKNLDNRPGSAVNDTNVDNSDLKQSLSIESNCLGSQKTDESDDRSNPESRNHETISSKEKDSVSMKSSNQRLKDPSSGQRRDLPQVSRWQDETQRGLLIEHLSSGKYECLVCCNVIRREAAIWSCANCYHVYHMYCIKKWAQSPASTVSPETMGGGWRCPTCQNPYLQVPSQYTCFCGKMKDPESSRFVTPHTCNETCGKERSRGCPHLCNILCHPGPCPPCSAFVMRSCDCGKTKRSVKCAGDATCFKCNEPCHRTLNCGSHECQSICHPGSCEPCAVMIEQKCHCKKEARTVKCGSAESFVKTFSCNGICSRKLFCGVHTCGEICHPGPCNECPLMPSKVTHCPCGKSLLTEISNGKPRKTCEDSIPTCGKACGKELKCGNEGAKHRCKQTCHPGPCTASCDGTTEVTCRCGAVTKELPCTEFLAITESSPFICDRRCKKKMSCGRHKCSQLCCVNSEHQCQLVCGYKLSCGIHRCEERCHRGNCPSCWQVSFDELRCHCGAEVIYPPVPCGAKPPECRRPCTRQHPCSHQATHHCHSEATCPPCTFLTQKWCLGHHELRSNIPCHITEISCGMQCGKELPCLIHKCLQPCHKGPCLEGQVCTQPCPMIREKCGHPCLAPCHQGSPCPPTACKAEITLQCECGRRKEKGQCLCGNEASSQSDYNKMTAQYVASKLWEGQSIDLGVLTKEGGITKKARKLQCNSECAIMERNQRLALALEIKNPDLSSKLGNPPYSQFLKDFAKQNATFVANVEKALSALVTTAQQVKVNRKSHAFKVMPSTQRRVIHELAEFYGCQTESYDEEPNKNVVATALKGKCWLPNVTLTALVQRELFPKAPIPIPINCKEEQIRSAAQGAKQSTEVFGTAKIQGGNSRRKKEAQIDYFDITD